MRIAFFGGTFDPPHLGHIAVARSAIERLALDRVLFAPVAAQPLKADGAKSSFADRMAMVRLAIGDDPRLTASNADAPRPDGKPNYTIDTLREIQATLSAGDRLFCLAGADALYSLKRWNRAAELLLFCDWIVAARPGFPLKEISSILPNEIEQLGWRRESQFIQVDLAGPKVGPGVGTGVRRSRLYLLPDFQADISATEIRAALAAGSETQTVLPPQVFEYIRSHGLYQRPASEGRSGL